MLKVLMLGWEFPPHISGGLGTACHGLTTALARNDIHVLFVVPRLTGDEDNTGATLLSASAPGNGEIKLSRVSTTVRQLQSVQPAEPAIISHQHITTIQIPSTLSAYNMAHVENPTYAISEWNYSLQGTRVAPAPGSTIDTEYVYINTHGYKFKGGYGNQLLEEVERYAGVIRNLAKKTHFDVIHAHDWMTFPAGIEASRVTGKPLIIHVHATEHDRAGMQGSSVVYDIERRAMRRSDRIIAVSDWTRRVLIHRYDADARKINVVHNGVQESPEVRPQAAIHPLGENMVTFLGRVTFQKGPEYFIDAAEKVLKEIPDCHFIMAGSGDALPKMIERVAAKRMSSRFHFTGFLNKKEIAEVLSYSRVYVMPSVSEPFGITPLEAIQAGVPVIISNQSGVAEVMPHALKVDFWNTDALSQSICSVLRYKSLAHTLKENGRERIRTITWESASRNVKKLYYETIRNN